MAFHTLIESQNGLGQTLKSERKTWAWQLKRQGPALLKSTNVVEAEGDERVGELATREAQCPSA